MLLHRGGQAQVLLDLALRHRCRPKALEPGRLRLGGRASPQALLFVPVYAPHLDRVYLLLFTQGRTRRILAVELEPEEAELLAQGEAFTLEMGQAEFEVTTEELAALLLLRRCLS